MFEWSKFLGSKIEAVMGDTVVVGVVVDDFGSVRIAPDFRLQLNDKWDVKLLVPTLVGAVIRFEDGQYAVRSNQDERFPWIALDGTGDMFADGDVRHMNFIVIFAGVDDA